MKDIGVGVIGLGMGRTVLAINEDKASRLAVRAVCDTNEELLARIKEQYRIPFATTDYRELIGRPEVAVVAIYSPDHLHMEHIEAAVKAGKHVICTKPMVVSLE